MKKLFLIILLIPLLQYSQNTNKVEYKLESGFSELLDSYLSFEIPVNCIELSGENLPPNSPENIICIFTCNDNYISFHHDLFGTEGETNEEIAKEVQDDKAIAEFKKGIESEENTKLNNISFMYVNDMPSYKSEVLLMDYDVEGLTYTIFQKERTLTVNIFTLSDEEIFDKTINSIKIEKRMSEKMNEKLFEISLESRDSILKEIDKEAAQVKKTIKGFYQSGAIKIEGFINDLNEADSLWSIYNKNGEKFCIINFDRGCVSTIDTYSSDGFRMSNDLFLGGLYERFYTKVCVSSFDDCIRWCYFKSLEAIDCQLLNEKLNNQDKKTLNTILKYVKNINDKISVFNENGKVDKKGKIKRNSNNQFVFIPN